MKKLFLTAAGLFLAATAQADTPPVVSAATPATPVVMTSDVVTTAPARRGLFGRLRGRNMRATPVTTTMTPMTTVAPMTTTPAAPTPMPMGGKVSNSMPSTGIVQTSGTTTPMTTTPMTSAMPVTSSTVVMPMSTTSTTRPMRMGLLRSRMLYYR